MEDNLTSADQLSYVTNGSKVEQVSLVGLLSELIYPTHSALKPILIWVELDWIDMKMSSIKCSSIDDTWIKFDEKFHKIYSTTCIADAFLLSSKITKEGHFIEFWKLEPAGANK